MKRSLLSIVFCLLLSTSVVGVEPSTRSHPDATGFGQRHQVWAQHRASAIVVFVANEQQMRAALADPRPMWIIPRGGMVVRANSRLVMKHGGKRILGLAPGGFVWLGSFQEQSADGKRLQAVSMENMTIATLPKHYNHPESGTNEDVLTFNAVQNALVRRLAIAGGLDEQFDARHGKHLSILDTLFIKARSKPGTDGRQPTHESHLLLCDYSQDPAEGGEYASAIRISYPNGWDRGGPFAKVGSFEALFQFTVGCMISVTSTLRSDTPDYAGHDQISNQMFNGHLTSAQNTVGPEERPGWRGADAINPNSRGRFYIGYLYYDNRLLKRNGSGNFHFNGSAVVDLIANAGRSGGHLRSYPRGAVKWMDEPYDFSVIPGYVPTPLPDPELVAQVVAREHGLWEQIKVARDARDDAKMAELYAQAQLPPWLVEVRDTAGPAAPNALIRWQRQHNRIRGDVYYGITDNTVLPAIDTAPMKLYPSRLVAWHEANGHKLRADGYAEIEHFHLEQEWAMLAAAAAGEDVWAAQDAVIAAWSAKTAADPLPEPVEPPVVIEPLPEPTPTEPPVVEPEPTPTLVWPTNYDPLALTHRNADLWQMQSRIDHRWSYDVDGKTGQWVAKPDDRMGWLGATFESLEAAHLALTIHDAERQNITLKFPMTPVDPPTSEPEPPVVVDPTPDEPPIEEPVEPEPLRIVITLPVDGVADALVQLLRTMLGDGVTVEVE